MHSGEEVGDGVLVQRTQPAGAESGGVLLSACMYAGSSVKKGAGAMGHNVSINKPNSLIVMEAKQVVSVFSTSSDKNLPPKQRIAVSRE